MFPGRLILLPLLVSKKVTQGFSRLMRLYAFKPTPMPTRLKPFCSGFTQQRRFPQPLPNPHPLICVLTMSNSTACDIVIIGGGPAGLSVASRLAKQSLKVIVIERSPVIGEVWANHYEGLRLNTVARLSRLGGKAFPSEAGQWPSKTDVVGQLQALAQASDAVFKLGEGVEQLRYNATEKAWVVTTNRASYQASEVVLATGGNQQAVYPEWAAEISSYSRVLHSSQYYS